MIKKSDSTNRLGNFSLSAKYLDEANGLTDYIKPEISALTYYNMACVYSLNREKTKALTYLEKSFFVSRLKSKATPVTSAHLSNDSDLDFIHDDSRYVALAKKYYSTKEFDFVIKTHEFRSSTEISYSDLLWYLELQSKTDELDKIVIGDKIIYWKKSVDSVEYNEGVLTLPNFEGLRSKTLQFVNCTFRLNFAWAEHSKSNENFYGIEFNNCKFIGRCSFTGLRFKNLFSFKKCYFNSNLQMSSYVEPRAGYFTDFGIDSCFLKFVFLNLWSEGPIQIQITNNISTDSAKLTFHSPKVSTAIVSGNSFGQSSLNISLPEVSEVIIRKNNFNDVMLTDTNIISKFDWEENTLGSNLILNKSYFTSDPASNIEWDQLNNLHLGLLKEGYDGLYVLENGEFQQAGAVPFKFITGEQREDISDPKNFDRLMGVYSMFLTLYKTKNNLELYNACFIQIKELQSKRLKYLYESKRTFESYFRWKLSQLLKFYVRHGTDPARAIVISLYIIFGFGIFFFFFPSDWDVTSKGRLVQNFNDFIKKNEKGYLKPFFVLLGGFALSLANAMTLSLNAFITLGFGNIPTHGIARYVCVIEGFMGWFLLSIFTVALINQVL